MSSHPVAILSDASLPHQIGAEARLEHAQIYRQCLVSYLLHLHLRFMWPGPPTLEGISLEKWNDTEAAGTAH